MDEWRSKLAEELTRGDLALLTQALILFAVLASCSLFALIQFLTMLMSRWGDKNPAPKAFVLSLMVHAIVMMCWSLAYMLDPVYFRKALPAQVAALESVPVRELIESDVEDAFDPGEVPVWKKINDLPAAEKERQDRESEELAEMAEAPLTPSDAEAPAIDPTELAQLASELPAAASPNQQAAPSEMPIKRPPVPIPEADIETTAENRPEAGASSPARRTPRKSEALDLGEETPKTRGSANAAAPNRPDDLSMSIPLDTAGENDDSPVLDGNPSETIRRGVAPTASNAPDGEFIPDGRTDTDGKPSRSRFNRTRPNRTTDGPGDTDVAERIERSGRPIDAIGADRMFKAPSNSARDSGGFSPAPSLETGKGPALPNRSPAAYKLRKLQQRRGTALKNGGSLESELAVEQSLKWLAKVQEPAGFWDADKWGGGAKQKDPHGWDRKGGGLQADSGLTGLALLAFMGAGYTPDDGDYARNVERGLNWLVQQQQGDGYLGGNAAHFDKMYCHAIATFALGEACGMEEHGNRTPEYRRALRKAVDFIVDRQSADGGWRYEKTQPGDMSMFGWQLMALKSADIAGIKAKPEVWNAMIEFLKERSLGENSGLAAYNPSQPQPTPAMTAEALFCKQMIGIKRTNPASQEAVAYIQQHPPRITHYDEYYWYYGTLSMFQYGGDEWEAWNDNTRDLLVRLQQNTGPQAGSWEPRGKWAGNGGRIYSTALSTLILEVYYRYLPIYQSGQE